MFFPLSKLIIFYLFSRNRARLWFSVVTLCKEYIDFTQCELRNWSMSNSSVETSAPRFGHKLWFKLSFGCLTNCRALSFMCWSNWGIGWSTYRCLEDQLFRKLKFFMEHVNYKGHLPVLQFNEMCKYDKIVLSLKITNTFNERWNSKRNVELSNRSSKRHVNIGKTMTLQWKIHNLATGCTFPGFNPELPRLLMTAAAASIIIVVIRCNFNQLQLYWRYKIENLLYVPLLLLFFSKTLLNTYSLLLSDSLMIDYFNTITQLCELSTVMESNVFETKT